MGNDFTVHTENLDRLAKSFHSGAVDLHATGSRFNSGVSAGSSPFGNGQAAASATEAYAAARAQMAESCRRLAALSGQTRDMLRVGSTLYASVEDSNARAARSFSPGD